MQRRNPSKTIRDPVRAAIYNPREFRTTPHACDDPSAHITSDSPTIQWVAVFFVLATLAIAYWLFSTSKEPVQPIPLTGILQPHTETSKPISLFEVVGMRNMHCWIRLDSQNTGQTMMQAFIRNGESLRNPIPFGIYRAVVACGKEWYGPNALFGRSALKINVPAPLTFIQLPSGMINGITLDLNQTHTQQ